MRLSQLLYLMLFLPFGWAVKCSSSSPPKQEVEQIQSGANSIRQTTPASCQKWRDLIKEKNWYQPQGECDFGPGRPILDCTNYPDYIVEEKDGEFIETIELANRVKVQAFSSGCVDFIHRSLLFNFSDGINESNSFDKVKELVNSINYNEDGARLGRDLNLDNLIKFPEVKKVFESGLGAVTVCGLKRIPTETNPCVWGEYIHKVEIIKNNKALTIELSFAFGA